MKKGKAALAGADNDMINGNELCLDVNIVYPAGVDIEGIGDGIGYGMLDVPKCDLPDRELLEARARAALRFLIGRR